MATHPFDVFFEENNYEPGDEPQAFADWLASQTGDRVVGMSTEGVVVAEPDCPEGTRA